MDETRRLNLTLRLAQPEHREAWEVLSTIPPRQRAHFNLPCHLQVPSPAEFAGCRPRDYPC